MAWIFLIAAILLEVSGTICMKRSNGLTELLPSVLLFGFYAASFSCLSFALRGIELGTAYAIWSGAGTALVLIIGAVLFGESINLSKLAAVGLIIVGVVWLHSAAAAPGVGNEARSAIPPAEG